MSLDLYSKVQEVIKMETFGVLGVWGRGLVAICTPWYGRVLHPVWSPVNAKTMLWRYVEVNLKELLGVFVPSTLQGARPTATWQVPL